MKLIMLKRLLDNIFDERTYFVQRKCLLEDIIKYDGSAACGDCEYSCFKRCCIAAGLRVLK